MLTRRALLAAVASGAAACRRGTAGTPPEWTSAPVPLPERFARGVNLAHQHVRGRGYGSEAAAAALDALRAHGVRDVALNPFACAPDLRSRELRWGGDPTLTDDDLCWWKWFTDAGPDRDDFVPAARAREVLAAWWAT